MPPLPDGPVGLPQYKTSYDPGAEYTSAIAPTDTIKEIYLKVMDEQPLDVSSAADAWDAFATHLGTIKSTLEHDYHGVRTHWDSEAGLLFEDFVDNTMLSLSDWQQAASRNAGALRDLASAIFLAQATIGALWTEFDHRVALVDRNHGGHAGDMPYGIMLELTNKAKSDVLEPLNKAYFDAFIASRPGGKFVGPTNGPSSAEYARALAKLKAPPGVVPLVVPGSGPSAVPDPPVPAAPPPRQDLPRRPTPPRPVRSPLPKRAAPPQPAPVPRRMPAMPPPPSAPVSPFDLPPSPYVPPRTADLTRLVPPENPLTGVPLTPHAFRVPAIAEPTALESLAPPPVAGPDLAESGIPARPSAPDVPSRLRGRGSVAEPELPRSAPRAPTPQLPGRGSRPNPPRTGTPHGQDPDAPPPRRGGPALPGRNGKDRRPERNGPPDGPGDDDVPPNRLGSQRNLLGIRDTKPRPRPGSAEVEASPLQRSARLNGRLGTQPGCADELPLRLPLNGRRGRPPADRQAGRANARTDLSRIDFVGDTDLFAPRASVPPVINRPAEVEPVPGEQHALRPVPPRI